MSNRRKAKMQPEEIEDQHSTPEERAARGAQFATFDDLEGLDRETLLSIVTDCSMTEVDSLICVPCRAYEILLEQDEAKRMEALEKLANPTMTTSDEVIEDSDDENLREHIAGTFSEAMAMHPDSDILLGVEEVPDVRMVLVEKVKDLNVTVQQMLAGPPIPPSNVSVAELAALVVGAEKWLTHIERQMDDGYVVNPEVQKIYDAVHATVKKVKGS